MQGKYQALQICQPETNLLCIMQVALDALQPRALLGAHLRKVPAKSENNPEKLSSLFVLCQY